jgi:hypothetical protein
MSAERNKDTRVEAMLALLAPNDQHRADARIAAMQIRVDASEAAAAAAEAQLRALQSRLSPDASSSGVPETPRTRAARDALRRQDSA